MTPASGARASTHLCRSRLVVAVQCGVPGVDCISVRPRLNWNLYWFSSVEWCEPHRSLIEPEAIFSPLARADFSREGRHLRCQYACGGPLQLLGLFVLTLTLASVMAVDCEFVLGFKALRDIIGHETVGECLDEHYNANGDSNQKTTGGLLVWRKADNHTAFPAVRYPWEPGPRRRRSHTNGATAWPDTFAPSCICRPTRQ